ncbi:MAG TPA: hypothetical protein VKU01_19805 [Bryobacteraceae bacterium]|nr:hypothetical protein [Bryobacteraceae bacterium]
MDVAAEYRARLEQRRAIQNTQERLHRRIGNYRLGVGLAAAVLSYFIFGRVWLSPFWLVVPFVVFMWLMWWHSRVLERLERANRAVKFYEQGMARIEDRWIGKGEGGEHYRDASHVYADDLDILGRGSLFELLCTARTLPGEEVLASWLLSPSSAEAVLERQQAVADLRERLDLREELAVLGETLRSGVKLEPLSKWGEEPPVRFPRGSRNAAKAIVAIFVITLGLYMAGVTKRTPFLAAILVELVFSGWLHQRVQRVHDAVQKPAQELSLVADVLRCIEQQKFAAPLLRRMQEELQIDHQIASDRIRRLGKLVDLWEYQHNQFLAPILAAFLWGTQMAMAVEEWRTRSGPGIRRWLLAVGEFEALCSLASYSFEHPADVFPTIAAGPAEFDAEALGHPLMSETGCVRNDVRLGGDLQLLIVSGSNMSGKSTLLRSVGLSTVMAWAGAPVRARRLKISPVTVGASIRVVDSLQDGRSRFYAEITRLRHIKDLTQGDRPLLFLIDEVLSGTNSHDRRIGAAAIVRSLVDRGAIGMITTHDLALVGIADMLEERAANVHFTDTIVDGQLQFNYHLMPGVVEHSNALELMRSVGLEV